MSSLLRAWRERRRVPWEPGSDPDLLPRLRLSLNSARVGRSDVLTWVCPRCEHEVRTKFERDETYVGLWGGDEPEVPRRATKTVYCDCGKPHLGRPADHEWQGCGFRADVQLAEEGS